MWCLRGSSDLILITDEKQLTEFLDVLFEERAFVSRLEIEQGIEALKTVTTTKPPNPELIKLGPMNPRLNWFSLRLLGYRI